MEPVAPFGVTCQEFRVMNKEVVPFLLRVRQVADRLGVSVRTVRRLIARGELPQPVKVGRSSCIPADEVVAYVERLKGERR